MRITGAFLAESAATVDGKLNVEGGVLRYYRVGPDRVAAIQLVVLTQFQAGDSDPRLDIELIAPTGDSQQMQADIPMAVPESPDGEIGFVFWALRAAVETDGRYLVVVRADEGSVSLPLTVIS